MSEVSLLSKEPSAFVGHRNSVLVVNIQLFLSSSELLLKFINVGDLHSVHECQPLQRGRNGGKEMRISAGYVHILVVCVSE